MKLLVLFIVSMCLAGCAGSKDSWIKIHEGDSRVIYTGITQYPESVEAASYEGAHPAIVEFEFEDGRKNKVYFEPSGKIITSEWLKDD